MIDDQRNEQAEAEWLTDDEWADLEDQNERADYAVRGERWIHEPWHLPVYGDWWPLMQPPAGPCWWDCPACQRLREMEASGG